MKTDLQQLEKVLLSEVTFKNMVRVNSLEVVIPEEKLKGTNIPNLLSFRHTDYSLSLPESIKGRFSRLLDEELQYLKAYCWLNDSKSLVFEIIAN